MLCPKCGALNDQVIDSRLTRDGAVIRRRRKCAKCGHRFTTYEEALKEDLMVLKKNGRREKFQREKLRVGIEKACEKRPVNAEQINRIVNEIIHEIEDAHERQVPSKAIGEIVMKKLREEDEVAYIRYASIYREFRDVNQFVKEIQLLNAAM